MTTPLLEVIDLHAEADGAPILRGVNLLGINSVTCPRPLRERIWQRLATGLDLNQLEPITRTIPLAELPRHARELLAGKVRGRLAVEIPA